MATAKGRKSVYEDKIKANFPLIKEYCRTMTDAQIAEAIGVSKSTFWKFKAEKKEFADLLRDGRANLVADLKSSLIRKAHGYEYTEKKIIKDKTGKIIRIEENVRYAHPDVAALNLLLKNYDKENWANDPQTLELRKKEIELREKQVNANVW